LIDRIEQTPGAHCGPFILAGLDIFRTIVRAVRGNVLNGVLGGLLEIASITCFRSVLVEKIYESFLFCRSPVRGWDIATANKLSESRMRQMDPHLSLTDALYAPQ
jgi:hypothetical protein